MGSKLHPRNFFSKRQALYCSKGGKCYICNVKVKAVLCLEVILAYFSCIIIEQNFLFLPEMINYSETLSPCFERTGQRNQTDSPFGIIVRSPLWSLAGLPTSFRFSPYQQSHVSGRAGANQKLKKSSLEEDWKQ